jgi:endoglucanase
MSLRQGGRRWFCRGWLALSVILAGTATANHGLPDLGHGLTAISKRVLLVQYMNLVPAGNAKDFPWRSLRILSPDDPGFAAGRAATDGSLWVRPLRHAARPPSSGVATWIFLTLDRDLVAGRTYEVDGGEARFLALDAATGTPVARGKETMPAPTVSCRWLGDRHPSPALQVNQVGYLPDGPKVAHLSQFIGQQFGRPQPTDLDFGKFSRFRIIREADGGIAHQGNLRPATATRHRREHRLDELSQSRVWEIDFTGLRETGRFHLQVPGLGRSPSFVIEPDVYNLVLGVLSRGMMHQRCGVALDEPWSRHARPPCHLEDARIPALGEYRRPDLSFLPQPEGQRRDMRGGHHAGAEYGKSTIQAALFVHRLLLPWSALPEERLNYDACPVPEAGDGVPDLLQEAILALDWLGRMQDEDGGFFTGVRPDLASAEAGLVDAGTAAHAKPRLAAWKDTSATAAAGAALACASRLPAISRHWPERARRYREQADLAWGFCRRQIGEDGRLRQVDGELEGRFLGALDEACWLAAEQWLATGDPEAHRFFLRHHRPGDGWRWLWQPLAESSGAATRAYAFGERDGMQESMRTECRAALLRGARESMAWQEKWAHPASFPEELFQGGRWAWYVLAEVASYDQLLAAELAPDEATARKFREAALRNCDRELGGHPGGVPMISGLGQRRLAALPHRLAHDGPVAEPVPGIPVGFHPSGFTPPPGMPAFRHGHPHGGRPVAYRHVDGWNVEQEMSLPALAATVMTYAMLGDPGRQRPGFPSLNLAANGQSTRLSGRAPFVVSFRAAAAGADGKLVREWHWDLDNGEFRSVPEFTHTFDQPGEYRVACTVSDDDGWIACRVVAIQVQPPADVSGEAMP